MWQDRLKQIINILESSNINEIEVNFWGRKFRVSKGKLASGDTDINPSSAPVQNITTTARTLPEDSLEEIADDVKGVEIRAPMVGTFYRAPSPESPSFVNTGSHVSIGQTLCIIEAMKIMNEITSETTGNITKILVENAQPVEYSQPLFIIEPD